MLFSINYSIYYYAKFNTNKIWSNDSSKYKLQNNIKTYTYLKYE